MQVIDFEKHIVDLELKLKELRHFSGQRDLNVVEEVARLEKQIQQELKKVYAKLTPWQKVQVARHPNRPHFSDYIAAIIKDFIPLAGDRTFGEDHALIGGIGTFDTYPVMVLGHEKGRETEERVYHNFGMAQPEGYRKAQRLMKLADKFSLPLMVFIDTPGAHPGIGAEARGQAEAIATSIELMTHLTIPVLAVVIGEGMSGGAIAIGVANEIYMLEHAVYSVISPEGCASILWRTRDMKEKAAQTMGLTAQDLIRFKIIDKIIPEPLGGAQRHWGETITSLAQTLKSGLKRFHKMSPESIRMHRRNKFLAQSIPISDRFPGF